MTFYEAAIEILGQAGRPLHYKKITEIAIKRRLLAHVGKTPEITMGVRLAQEVKKDGDERILTRTRPGVFGLRIWETSSDSPALPSLTPVAEAPPQRSVPEVEAPHRSSKSADKQPPTPKPADKQATPKPADKQPPTPKPADKQPPTPKLTDRSAGEGSTVGIPVAFSSVITEQIYQTLSTRRSPIHLSALSRLLFDGEGTYKPQNPEEVIRATLVSEDGQRLQRQQLPLFLLQPDGNVRLREWDLPPAFRDSLKGALSSIDDLNRHCRASLKLMIRELTQTAREYLVFRLLSAMGYEKITAAKRARHDVIFTACEQSLSHRGKVAIQLKGKQYDITPSDVIQLRGSLHHYQAKAATILTFGKVEPPAVQEASIENLSPVSLVDGDELIGYLCLHGIGVQRFSVPVTLPDLSVDGLPGILSEG